MVAAWLLIEPTIRPTFGLYASLIGFHPR